MKKTLLITGSTDGIGLATAEKLVTLGHKVLLHGRNPAKLDAVATRLAALPGAGSVESYVADLSTMQAVRDLADTLINTQQTIDVLINNAGVFRSGETVTAEGLDVRFAVNTIAPYLLTQRLLPLLGGSGRVVNLSSAAQAPVDCKAIIGEVKLDDMAAYSQSKLAITMWTRSLAKQLTDKGPLLVAVNPGSLLASKMVTEGFGVAGNDIAIGVDILVSAALSEEFAHVSGQYFDNDAKQFTAPHADALNDGKCLAVLAAIQSVLSFTKTST